MCEPDVFHRYTNRRKMAILKLAFLAIMLLACVGITFSPWRSGFADFPGRRPSDVELYQAEVDRIHAGESYYSAAGTELRARGYPTRSVFNWRTPLPMWLVGVIPDPVLAKGLLCGMCLITLCLGFAICSDEGSLSAGIAFAIAFSGTALPCLLGNSFLLPELWSGMLIALSVGCYGRGHRAAGLLAGISALFVRELAAPYCLLAAALAVRHRRWREVVLWMAGFAAYAIFYVAHWHTVQGFIGADDVAHDRGWVRFGGAAFVISTAQMNAYLLLLPQWVSALFLVLSLLGLSRWSSAAGERIGLTVAGYVLAFGIVGQDFNQYWGSMFAPLLCFGIARALPALADLWKLASGNGAPAVIARPG